jgi:hypothetical protein
MDINAEWGRTFVEVERLKRADLLVYTREVEQYAALFQEQLLNPTAAFWLVWRDSYNSTPHYKHRSKESAEREAERLAREFPGERFYVLPALANAVCKIQPVVWEEGGTSASEEKEIPF